MEFNSGFKGLIFPKGLVDLNTTCTETLVKQILKWYKWVTRPEPQVKEDIFNLYVIWSENSWIVLEYALIIFAYLDLPLSFSLSLSRFWRSFSLLSSSAKSSGVLCLCPELKYTYIFVQNTWQQKQHLPQLYVTRPCMWYSGTTMKTREEIFLISNLGHVLNVVCFLLDNSPLPEFYMPMLTLRRLMSYIYGAPILDVSRSHATTQHSR